ncbi:MAG: hypothetical protein J6C96_01675 [Oscillospiraceae bacterium]|nr:hypothetical protein [Oscillospiraceae bacterium]
MDRMINENHVSDITEKPELYQMNNAPVNPSLEKYIFNGKTCTMDDRLYNAFCASASKTANLSDIFSVILKVFGILTLASVFIPIISIVILVIQMIHDPDNIYPAALLIPIFIALGIVVGGLALIKLSSKMEEQHRTYSDIMGSVKPRFTECYMYKRRQIVRYAYEGIDSTEYRYFIELKDFYVELPNPSEKWERAEYAYAVIININGKDMFFLFNDVE